MSSFWHQNCTRPRGARKLLILLGEVQQATGQEVQQGAENSFYFSFPFYSIDSLWDRGPAYRPTLACALRFDLPHPRYARGSPLGSGSAQVPRAQQDAPRARAALSWAQGQETRPACHAYLED